MRYCSSLRLTDRENEAGVYKDVIITAEGCVVHFEQ